MAGVVILGPRAIGLVPFWGYSEVHHGSAIMTKIQQTSASADTTNIQTLSLGTPSKPTVLNVRSKSGELLDSLRVVLLER